MPPARCKGGVLVGDAGYKRPMQGWKVLVAMLLGALLFFGVAALMMPSTFQVAKALWIPAPPSVVFDVVSDVRSWERWSIWSRDKDPSMAFGYAGPERGIGATVRWTSETYGDGQRVVTEVQTPKRLTLERTLAGSGTPAIERITLQPLADERGSGTRVIWGMAGDVGGDLSARLGVGVLQRSAARDYEENLVRLKHHVETEVLQRPQP